MFVKRNALLLVVLFTSALLAQSPGKQSGVKSQSLKSKAPRMSQQIQDAAGRPIPLNREKLSAGSPLKMDIEGLSWDSVPTNEQTEGIYKRIRDLEEAVNNALALEIGEFSSDRVIKRLEEACNNSANDKLKDDLKSGLLIAALNDATLMPADGSGAFKTTVWSYRQLFKQDNWGPKIETEPGKVLLIGVLNLLDKEELQRATVPDFGIVDPVETGELPSKAANGPKHFDVINLHTHGLNVSPNWPADNIFREIHPRKLKFYIYQIPADHPAGTYFYHPHMHGSVATQVAGGMAGPLIVRDRSRGLDALGEAHGWGSPKEDVLMFQQLTLYKLTEDSKDRFIRPDFFALKDIAPDEGTRCIDRPTIKSISDRLLGMPVGQEPIFRLPTVETWVSGKFRPEVASGLALGDVRRFRLIHAGVEELIRFGVRPSKDFPNAPPALVQVIAFDGIPLEQPYFLTDQHRLTLAPANRADVLVSVPASPAIESGDATVIQYEIISFAPDGGDPLPLATFTVDPSKPVNTTSRFVTSAEGEQIFAQCAPKLDAPQLPNHEAFDLAFADASIDADGKFVPGIFTIDRKPFPLDQKEFRLNRSENLELAITGGDAPHPLHIHVNPFLVPEDLERGASGLPTGRFWSDTILIPTQTSLTVQMPFHLWPGKSVSHCHILDHEDAGMMCTIDIYGSRLSWPDLLPTRNLDLVKLPKDIFSRLAQVPGSSGSPNLTPPPGHVYLIFFMPPGSDKDACPHCSDAFRAIQDLRAKLAQTKVHFVVISGTQVDKLSTLAKSSTTAGPDWFFADPEFHAFEAMGLIDAIPSSSTGPLKCPAAFKPTTRELSVHSDLMHGLFIVDSTGMIVSTRRSFLAFDDTAHIMDEVRLALESREAQMASFETKIESSPAIQAHAKSHLERFKNRTQLFQANDQ